MWSYYKCINVADGEKCEGDITPKYCLSYFMTFKTAFGPQLFGNTQ